MHLVNSQSHPQDAPLKILLGRGVANHPRFAAAVKASELGRRVLVGVHHTHAPHESDGPADVYLPEKSAASPGAYVDDCLAACQSWGADIFWPGRELVAFAERAGEFIHSGCRLLVCGSAPTLELLENKARSYAFSESIGIPAPQSIVFEDLAAFEDAYRVVRNCGERVCFKPVRGVFGRGFRVVRDDLNPLDELFEDPSYRIDLEDARRRFGTRDRFRPMLAMAWLDGAEVSVDCFRSSDGTHFCAVPRQKASSTEQRLMPAPELVSASRKLADSLGLRGLFNCQFKYHRGKPFLLEVNARPAGAVGLTLHAGVNLTEMALRDAFGLSVPAVSPQLGCRLTSAVTWARHQGESGTPCPRLDSVPAAKFDHELPTGNISVRQLEGDWHLGALLTVAARHNSTRGYLLVSRVLGKHLPVTPARMGDSHWALCEKLPLLLPGPVLFVGMGETATGLGWGVWDAWKRKTGRTDGMYIHTTRYPAVDHRLLPFEEAHSHGPVQVLCVPKDPELRERWDQTQTLVVVDDEITTGRTLRQVSQVLEADGLPLRERHALTLVATSDGSVPNEDTPLTGWRIGALATAQVDWSASAQPSERLAPQGLTHLGQATGARMWGRVGAFAYPPPPAQVIRCLDLQIGTSSIVYLIAPGECMHPAFVLGQVLEATGRIVLLQSSSRSPVLLGEAIRSSLDCADGLGSGVRFFVHNPPPPGSSIVALHESGGFESVRSLVEQLGAVALEVWDA